MAWFSNASSEKRLKAKKQRSLAKKADADRKELFKELKKEADGYLAILVKTAYNKGYREILRGFLAPNIFEFWMGKGPIRYLKFTHVLMDEYRLWFRINSRELPGISHEDIKHESFVYDLSRAVGKDVRYEGTPQSGDFIVIERDSGISGIPNYLSMGKAYEWIPDTADALTFCVGQAEHSQPLIVSLTQLPHLLVAGTTRSGKSVCINNLICTYAVRNSPDVVQMALIDMKSGLEFGPYKGLPNLMHTEGTKYDGIAFNAAEAKIVLKAIIAEMARRGEKFGAVGARNIEEYHSLQDDDRVPYLVPIIDELSVLLFNMDKEITKMAKYLMNDILATGAAYGIHVVVCTQDPSREIVPRHLRSNLPARICFRTTSIPASIAVLENKHAYRLKPKGRGVFQFDEEYQFQGPMISTVMVKRHVKRLIADHAAKKPAASKATIGLPELLQWALNNRGGSLAWDYLWQEFGPQGLSQERIKQMLKEADDQQFTIEGTLYHVTKPKPGDKAGRRLVLLQPAPEQYQPQQDNLMAAD